MRVPRVRRKIFRRIFSGFADSLAQGIFLSCKLSPVSPAAVFSPGGRCIASPGFFAESGGRGSSFTGFFHQLFADQFREFPVFPKQFGVGALLRDFSPVHHDDAVKIDDRGKPVRHH